MSESTEQQPQPRPVFRSTLTGLGLGLGWAAFSMPPHPDNVMALGIWGLHALTVAILAKAGLDIVSAIIKWNSASIPRLIKRVAKTS